MVSGAVEMADSFLVTSMDNFLLGPITDDFLTTPVMFLVMESQFVDVDLQRFMGTAYPNMA